MVAPSALKFIGLNALRLLSVCILLLTVAALIDLMVIDAKAINELSAEEKSDVEEDCSYFAGTSVPTHVWGLFWCQLNRTFLIILAFIGLASELNWGGLAERFFNHNIPMLSSSFSTMPLGVLEIMIGTCMLSSFLWIFPLVVAWMLVVIGLTNVILGALFRSKGKDIRSVVARKQKKADIKEVRWAPPSEKRLTVQMLRPTNVRENAWHAFEKLRKGKDSTADRAAVGLASTRSGTSHSPPWSDPNSAARDSAGAADIKLARANSRSAHPDQASDFPSLETSGQSELLRQRAREANVRAEREQEERERKMFELRRLMQLEDEQEYNAERDLEAGMRRLSEEYEWNDEKSIAVPRAHAHDDKSADQEDRAALSAPIWAAHRTPDDARERKEITQQAAKKGAHDFMHRGRVKAGEDSTAWNEGAGDPSRAGASVPASREPQVSGRRWPRSPGFGSSAREFTARVGRRSLVLSRHLKELKATAVSPKSPKFTVGKGNPKARVPRLPLSKASGGQPIPGRFPKSPTRYVTRPRRATNASSTARSSYYESADEEPASPADRQHPTQDAVEDRQPISTHYDGANFDVIEVGLPPLPIRAEEVFKLGRSASSVNKQTMPRMPPRAFVEAGGGRVMKAEPDDEFRKDSLDSLSSTIQPGVNASLGEGHIIIHEADGKKNTASRYPVARQWASEWNRDRLLRDDTDDEISKTKRPLNIPDGRSLKSRAQQTSPVATYRTDAWAPKSRRHVPSSGPPI